MNRAASQNEKPIMAELKRIASFGAVGVFNGLVNYAVFMALVLMVLRPAGLEGSRLAIALANMAAWAIAVTNSYVMNAKLTFKAESGGELSWGGYGRFAAAGLVGMVAETGSLLIAREFVPLWGAKLVSIGVAFVVNFTMTRLFVFR